ncbi:hypothetical protein HN385_01930 [archaeon]|jgi:hypothetical protein|nr:hypothetical protein [archaeon]MBT3451291.1 hypothetical protein [archaeon]MBT6869448.1 hypothetical protein [archaeon]MBT7192611.1 hypothetical protein [archaeon]MBT7380687.1 hypothetical protein [archaeon]
MIKSKLNILIIVLLISIFCLINVENVNSINMMGARTEISYSPGNVETLDYYISNVDSLKVTTEGALAVGAVVLDEEYNEEENSWRIDCDGDCTVRIELTIPDMGSSPGWHDFIVLFEEAPEEVYGKAMMAATAAIRSRVKMIVPYPGKYLEASFSVEEADRNVMQGEKKYFTVNAHSYGSEIINYVGGNITITDSSDGLSDNNWVVDLTEASSLTESQSASLYAEWDTSDIEIGSYYAYGDVFYDDNSTTASIYYFNVGSEYVEVDRVDPLELITGGINKISLRYFNHWASNLDTHSYLSLKNKNSSEELAYVTTSTGNVVGQNYGATEGYLDLTNVSVGEYNLDIETFYGSSSNVISFNVSVVEGQIEEIIEEVIVENEPVGINAYLLYGVIILVTLLTLGALIFLFMKSRDKGDEDEFAEYGDDFGGSGGGSDF